LDRKENTFLKIKTFYVFFPKFLSKKGECYNYYRRPKIPEKIVAQKMRLKKHYSPKRVDVKF
jgi:hypothetical protein